MADRPVPGYAANFIPGLQAVFPSANAALAYLREAGFGVRRQNFLHEWGAQISEEAARPAHYRATLEQMPAVRAVTQRRAPKARGFHYVVEHLIQDPETGEVYQTYGGYRSSRLVAYGEALLGAEQAFVEGQLADERYPQGELIGSIVTAVREYLPELAEPEDLAA